MTAPFVAPAMQRTLAAVYRFYDAFFFPVDDDTPAVASSLDVSIPALRWSALRADSDLTYRFSASTLSHPPPSGLNLAVEVTAPGGDYINFEPILLTLPLAVSLPPKRSDFLITRPVWPTVALRLPLGETAIRAHLTSPTAQPVAGLTVQMWPGASITPPPGTPFTRSDGNGDFLVRFPLLKGAAGAAMPFGIRLNNGAIAVTPASLPVVLGGTRTIHFQRT